METLDAGGTQVILRVQSNIARPRAKEFACGHASRRKDRKDLARLARQVETHPQPTNPQHTDISHDTLYENEQHLRALVTASSDAMYRMSAD